MLNFSTKIVAFAVQLCQEKHKLQAVDQIWPETLLLHPDVPKIIQYPIFENTCALDLSCEQCSPLSQIKIACNGCQTDSAVNASNNQSILIHGAASPNAAPLDLELIATWPDGAESSVQRMKVNFVDPLCDSSHFTDLKNLLLRADVGSKKSVTKTLGPFLNSADSCGGRVFSVIGRCLSLARDDNTVSISLNPSDNRECQTPGVYYGGLIINFDRYNNGQSLINFKYALDCRPEVQLVGSDASVHNYIVGGPKLYINLGTWTQKSSCGGVVSSNLKYFDQAPQDWFKYDQISQQLQIFGHPQIFEGHLFEFIFEAYQDGRLIASSVFRINFVGESSYLADQVIEQSLVEASHPRKLLDCLASTFPATVTLSQSAPSFSFSYPTDPRNCCPSCVPGGTCIRRILIPYIISCLVTGNSQFNEAVPQNTLSTLGFNYNAQNTFGGTYPLSVKCNCTDATTSYVDSVINLTVLPTPTTSCTTGNHMVLPSPGPSPITIGQGFLSVVIYALNDQTSFNQGSLSPPYYCGPRTCSYSVVSWVNNVSGACPSTDCSNLVYWEPNSQTFSIVNYSTIGSYKVTMTCNAPGVPPDSFFVLVTVVASCKNGNAMIQPSLPPVSIDQTYFATTIPAFSDVFSGNSNPPTCGPRTCSSNNNPNVVWSDASQFFTVQSLGLSDVVGTSTVTLKCSITSESTISGSSSFTLTISLCILTSATSTISGIGQINYIIGNPIATYPFTVTFLPSTCALAYSSYVSAIDTAGASTLQYATITSTDITIYTLDYSLAALIPVRWWQVPTANPSQTPFYFNFNLNLINPCLTGWTPQTLSLSLLVANILGPPVLSTATSFVPPLANCGLVTYTIPAQPSYISLIGLQITVLATAMDPVGTTNFILRATSIDWPSITYDQTFTVQIDLCVLTSIGTSPLIAGTITKNIFQAATPYTISIYTQTPACGYNPSYVLQATKQLPSLGILQISPPFWLLDASNMVIQLQSNDLTLDATHWNVDLVVTIGSKTNTQTIAVTWVDPCLTTNFVGSPIADSFGFIANPAIVVNVPVPWLNDSANISYGSSTASSICNAQSFVITEIGLTPPPYLTTSFDTASGQNSMQLATTNALMAGPHVITIKYSLDLYPTVTNTATFNFIFYQLIAPVAPATTTYQVTSPTLDIPISSFQVNPVNPAMVITYSVQLTNGGLWPVFIAFSEFGQGSTASRKLTLNTVNNSFVGTYQILVTVTFSLTPQPAVTQTQTFTLQVTAAPVAALPQINQAPFFTQPLEVQFEFQYGKPWLPIYKLPPTLDPEGQTVIITVDYGTASSFLSYNAQTNEFKMTVITTAQDIGTHPVSVFVSDPQGKTTAYSFLLKILDQPLKQQYVAAATNPDQASSPKSSQRQSNTQIVLVAYDFDVVTTPLSYYSTDLQTLASYAAQQFPAYGETDGTGFDWMNSFFRLLDPKNEKNASKYPEPNLTVTSITNTGKIKISFSNKMFVPPLEQINKAAFPAANHARMLSKIVIKVRALQVRAIPGSESFKQNLTLSYNITSFKERSMEIQLYFEKALAVSSNSIPDEVEIKVPGNFYYFDTRGNVLPKDIAIRMKLPKQMPLNAATKAVAEAAEATKVTTTCVMSTNLALNIFLSASLQQLWSMVGTQQIVVLMPLWTVNPPGNAAMFYGFVMQIAAFDVVPTGDFYDKFLPDMPTTGPINQNFDAIGFQGMYFLYNSGSIMISILAVPVLALIVGILRPCIKYKYPLMLYRKVKSYVFWNGTFQTITGTYTILVMCVLINTKNITFESTGEIISSSFTILFAIILAIFPLTACIWLRKNFDRLEEKEMVQLLGSVYSGLDLRRGRPVLWQMVFFYARRALIPLSVVYNEYLIVQILTMVFFVIAQVIMIGQVKPFKGGVPANKLEMFNESMLMMIMYTFLCFTDFVPNLETQFTVGYVSCGLVMIHLLVCLGIMSVGSFRKIRLRVQFMMLKCKHKIKMNKRIINKKIANDDLARSVTENQIDYKISRAAKKRNRLAAAVEEASKIDVVEDQERGDFYSLRRLEKEFQEAKVATHVQTPSFNEPQMKNEREEQFEREMDKVLQENEKFQKILDNLKNQTKPKNTSQAIQMARQPRRVVAEQNVLEHRFMKKLKPKSEDPEWGEKIARQNRQLMRLVDDNGTTTIILE